MQRIVQDEAQELGVDPTLGIPIEQMTTLECMLSNMRRKMVRGDWDGAEQSAQAAAPYYHPRLATAQVTVQRGPSRSREELLRELARLQELNSMPPLGRLERPVREAETVQVSPTEPEGAQ
ncbi:MAG: hypothetical protein JOY71_18260 [Acetobacteraceae bacterium]|nr:hypothetical protein [Acetobacteraceae bacterium]